MQRFMSAQPQRARLDTQPQAASLTTPHGRCGGWSETEAPYALSRHL